MPSDVKRFVAESNYIEGIRRFPTEAEVAAHIMILESPKLTIELLQEFVAVIAPGHELRERLGLNVRVSNHVAPMGGPNIRVRLRKLLQSKATPFHIHRAYMTLHPFTDGNGRSGRAIWLRQMGGPERVPLGFLHTFYYDTLAAGDAQ